MTPVTIRGKNYKSIADAAKDIGVTPQAISVAMRQNRLDTVGTTKRPKSDYSELHETLRSMSVGQTKHLTPAHMASTRAAIHAHHPQQFVTRLLGDGRLYVHRKRPSPARRIMADKTPDWRETYGA